MRHSAFPALYKSDGAVSLPTLLAVVGGGQDIKPKGFGAAQQELATTRARHPAAESQAVRS
jgi:hypothetical protein